MSAADIGPDGWYCPARRYDSPHCDARPQSLEPDLLVIHNISLPRGRFGGPHIADLFTGRLDIHADPSFAELRAARVSAHFLLRRDGSVLQFVPTVLRAWHAGVSSFEGRERCNDFSIGIEVEGSDDVAFSPAQYPALAALTLALAARHPLSTVLGHEHIAPGRKTDPGPFFDWQHYAGLVSQLAHNGAPEQVQTAVKTGSGLVPAHRQLRIGPMLSDVKTDDKKK
jgi:AmpD protein